MRKKVPVATGGRRHWSSAYLRVRLRSVRGSGGLPFAAVSCNVVRRRVARIGIAGLGICFGLRRSLRIEAGLFDARIAIALTGGRLVWRECGFALALGGL